MIVISLTFLSYLLLTLFLAAALKKAAACYKVRCHVLATAAIALHAVLLYQLIDTQIGQNLSILNVHSCIWWLVFVSIFLLRLRGQPVQFLQLVVAPCAACSALAAFIWPDSYLIQAADSREELLHILISLLAFGCLTVGGLLALMLIWQQHSLKNHHGNMVLLLPPLETVELLLFQTITLGFVLLTVSLFSGWAFLWSQPQAILLQKVSFACVAWLIFAALLFGRHCFAWRGQTAVRFTLAGFLLLVLSYFGTRLFL